MSPTSTFKALVPPRKTEIVWVTQEYGVVDFGTDAADALVDRFGVGDSGSGGGGGGDLDLDDCCNIKVYYDDLNEDTDTPATLGEWLDLPGMVRTIAVDRPSVLVMRAQVIVACEDIATVVGAQFQSRFLVNDIEVTGRARWSVTDADLRLPGKTDKAVQTVHVQAIYWLTPDVEYTYKLQISNDIDTTTFTAKVGHAGEGNDTHIVATVYPQEIERYGNEGQNIFKILDFCYDAFQDKIIVLRMRFFYEDGEPAARVTAGDNPDEAYIETCEYLTSELPLTATLPTHGAVSGGGRVNYRRSVTPANAFYYFSWGMAANPADGRVGFCYTSSSGEETGDYSQNYYTVIHEPGGSEIIFDTIDGPNWVIIQTGGAVWSQGFLYMIEPAADTTAQETSIPFKSGKRVTKRAMDTYSTGIPSGSITGEWPIECDPGFRVRWPIALFNISGFPELLYAEVQTLTVTTIWMQPLETIGSTDECFFDVATPAEMQTVLHVGGFVSSQGTPFLTAGANSKGYGWMQFNDPTQTDPPLPVNQELIWTFATRFDRKTERVPTGVLKFVRGAYGNARTESWLEFYVDPSNWLVSVSNWPAY